MGKPPRGMSGPSMTETHVPGNIPAVGASCGSEDLSFCFGNVVAHCHSSLPATSVLPHTLLRTMDNDASTNEKGKAKAGNSRTEEASGQNNSNSSLRNQIVDSAKGLFRDAVAPGADAAQTIASSSTFSDKAATSSSSNAASGLTYHLTSRRRVPESSGEGRQTSGAVGESFRTRSEDHQIEKQFTEFSSQDQHDSGKTSEHTPGLDALEASWQTATTITRPNGTNDSQYTAQASHDDGAEVRALLADPNFSADMDTGLEDFNETPQQTVDDLFPQNFSAEEQHAISQLRNSLPQPPVHRQMPESHPLSLIPRSDQENHAIEQNIQGILDGTFTDQQVSTGSATNVEGDEWLSNWIGVLNSYTDEVWGDMLPVVQETRAHLEEVKAGSTAIDNKAVARLKMIIGHLEHNR